MLFCCSAIVDRCHNSLHGWVKRRVIILFCLFEISICILTAHLFWIVPEIAHLHFAGFKTCTSMMIMRTMCSIAGIVGVGRRSIRTTRLYLWCLPLGIIFCVSVCWPLLTTQCKCKDFLQCEILKGFGEGKVANEFPAPADQKPAPTPTAETTLTAKTHRRLNLLRQVGKSQAEPPQQLQALQHIQELVLNGSLQAVTLSESSKTVLRSRRLGRAKKRKRSDDEEEDDNDLITRSEADKLVKDLLKRFCTCAGVVFSPDSKRETCNAWVNPKNPALVEHWCYIREDSRKECQIDEDSVKLATGNNLPWSVQHCERQGCKCSFAAMDPGSADMRSGMVDEHYGNICGLWRHSDKAPWCFVGFDTTCADRKAYTVSPTTSKVKELVQVSQFESQIPCQSMAIEEAGTKCLLTVICYVASLLLLNLSTFPIAVIVWIFLRNRCGDDFETSIQFEVELSDQESVEDFDVDAVDAELEALPDEVRRSHFVNIAGLDTGEEKKKKKDKKEKKQKGTDHGDPGDEEGGKKKKDKKEKKDKKDNKDKKHGKENDENTEIELCKW